MAEKDIHSAELYIAEEDVYWLGESQNFTLVEMEKWARSRCWSSLRQIIDRQRRLPLFPVQDCGMQFEIKEHTKDCPMCGNDGCGSVTVKIACTAEECQLAKGCANLIEQINNRVENLGDEDFTEEAI